MLESVDEVVVFTLRLLESVFVVVLVRLFELAVLTLRLLESVDDTLVFTVGALVLVEVLVLVVVLVFVLPILLLPLFESLTVESCA